MKRFEYDKREGQKVTGVRVDGVELKVSEEVIDYLSIHSILSPKYSTKVAENLTKITVKNNISLHKEICSVLTTEATKKALKELRANGVDCYPKLINIKLKLFGNKEILLFV